MPLGRILEWSKSLQIATIFMNLSGSATGSAIPPILLLTMAFTIPLILFIFHLRNKTYRKLVNAGLPTVFWTPRFVNYKPPTTTSHTADSKLTSGNITNILPRMRRLNGPYHMYGTVYGFNTAVVHVAHPVPALRILQHYQESRQKMWTATGVVKEPAYNHFKDFCGNGVFTADGLDWKQKRTAVLHALFPHKEWENDLLVLAQQKARALVHHLRRIRNDNDQQNVVPILQETTIGLIYEYITHTPLLKTGPNSSNKDYDEDKSLLQRYLQSITHIRLIILAQARSVWFLMPRWVYRWLAPLARAEEETMGPIKHFAQQAMAQAQPHSPLSMLQQKSRLYAHTTSNENLLFETITLLFAGQDTSAATLSWTLHLLSLYPTVQTKLATEIRAFRKKEGFSKKDFLQMPYLDAVLKEAMRLYPVAPFVVRKVTQPLGIPDESGKGTVLLPQGSLACIWIYGLHRNPDFWDHPHEFCPERWLDSKSTVVPGTFMPFAQGPRSCLGQPLAYIILRCLLAELVDAFEFTDAEKSVQRKEMQAGFTVLPHGGVSLVWTIRY